MKLRWSKTWWLLQRVALFILSLKQNKFYELDAIKTQLFLKKMMKNQFSM